jgi:cysteine desulfurase
VIYLDNASTTKIHPKVIKAMLPFLTEIYGNPNSLYYTQATQAKEAVERARQQVADLFGVVKEDVIFTSGAGESNNMVIKGVADKYPGCHIIASSVEHSTIIETLNFLHRKGFEVTFLPVETNGTIALDQLRSAIKPNTKLVSIMWANNEVGSLNDVRQIGEFCSENGLLFHTDATQAVGKVDTNIKGLKIDFLSMSAHKIYGPKGVGCLIIKHNDIFDPKITPLIHGGEQEFGLRGSTLPTHQIVGLGAAAELLSGDLADNIVKLNNLEDKLINRLNQQYGSRIVFNNSFQPKLPGVLSVRFVGINNQILLKAISNDISASSGAACSNSKPSHVLESMGLSADEISQTIRLSLSPYDEYNDFEYFK